MKKLIYSFLAIDIVIFALLAMNGGLKPPKYDLKPAQFQQAIQSGNVQFVDVRTPSEYEQARIKGAELIDWKSPDFKEKIQHLDKNKPVYIYCRTGMRAARAQRYMRKHGFKEVYNLVGGIKGWYRAGLPVETKPGYSLADDHAEGC